MSRLSSCQLQSLIGILSLQERIAAVEVMRELNYDYDPAAERVQRARAIHVARRT